MVLVVENDACLREVLAEIVAFLGFVVKVARDADEAVSVARDIQPAAILLDVSYPHGTDFADARALQADPVTTTVPLIALQDLPKHGAYPAGATEILPRPFDLTDLEASLRRHARAFPLLFVRAKVVVEGDGCRGARRRARRWR